MIDELLKRLPVALYSGGLYIQKCEVRYKNHILVFPTKEMRDAFY